jgi:hypothetical protein
VSASIAQGFRLVWGVFRVMQSALLERPGPWMPTTTPDSQRPIHDIDWREWLDVRSSRCTIRVEMPADNVVWLASQPTRSELCLDRASAGPSSRATKGGQIPDLTPRSNQSPYNRMP